MPAAEGRLLSLCHAEGAGSRTAVGENEETELVARFQATNPA